GAHLAALVATDATYLAAHDLEPADLAGVVLLDGAGYDLPRNYADARFFARQMYATVFGTDEDGQRAASPVTHVATGRAYPDFLIIHAEPREVSGTQADLLADALRSAGGRAEVVAIPDATHASVNRNFGLKDDPTTGAVVEFLNGRDNR
ncbi:MAG: alpha/beta hydrolase, partial [Planctomycetota bacterium]